MKRIYCLIIVIIFSANVLNAQWIPLTNALAGDIQKLHVFNSNLYAGGTASIFRSTDDGITWTSRLPIPSYAWSIASGGSNIYCGVWSGAMVNSGVYRSINNGLDWELIGLANKNISDIAADENQVVAITFVETGGVYKSTNAGINWFSIKGSLNLGVYVLAISGNLILAGGQGLHMTVNDGASWTPIYMADNIGSVCINGNVIFAGTYGSGLMRSTNLGSTWVQTLSTTKRINSIYANNDYVFVGVDSGFYVSVDGGLSFTDKSQGIETASISSSIIKGTNVFVANSNYQSINVSAWKRDLQQVVGIKQITSTIADSYSLHQNFPNPFNPITKITFDLPKSDFVSIVVFDLLGREIATLVNDELYAGTYEVNWNATGFTSGVYFYKMETPDFSKTMKMILTK